MSVSPVRPKGPPLNAMRAFEAAARTQSFTAAAEELGVTPGAISQHVKALEGWVGRALFRRGAQGVELTEPGRSLLPQFVAAFDALGAATQSLRLQRPGVEIHIAALPSIAQLWLPARLARLRRALPEIRISVTAMEAPPNLARELFDLSLFFKLRAAGPDEMKIDRDEIFPVCAPDFAHRLETPAMLDSVPLLHDQSWQTDWTVWSEATGANLKNANAGPRYSLYSLALEEAKAGAGVLMGHSSLVGEALKSGQLVQPFEARCATGRSLVLGLPASGRRSPDLDRMVDLLVD
ncbi:MAG: LysR family transcriptional regulator [Rhodobiaceae bacterium]|nr:LysR family transcriptional regulator [Rhodobiaceae bacterium]MCC0049706.1 LysR family transcriptional regulator [Rhodobiaceae bacterium]